VWPQVLRPRPSARIFLGLTLPGTTSRRPVPVPRFLLRKVIAASGTSAATRNSASASLSSFLTGRPGGGRSGFLSSSSTNQRLHPSRSGPLASSNGGSFNALKTSAQPLERSRRWPAARHEIDAAHPIKSPMRSSHRATRPDTHANFWRPPLHERGHRRLRARARLTASSAAFNAGLRLPLFAGSLMAFPVVCAAYSPFARRALPATRPCRRR
jgi:hypothetical protein